MPWPSSPLRGTPVPFSGSKRPGIPSLSFTPPTTDHWLRLASPVLRSFQPVRFLPLKSFSFSAFLAAAEVKRKPAVNGRARERRVGQRIGKSPWRDRDQREGVRPRL